MYTALNDEQKQFLENDLIQSFMESMHLVGKSNKSLFKHWDDANKILIKNFYKGVWICFSIYCFSKK